MLNLLTPKKIGLGLLLLLLLGGGGALVANSLDGDDPEEVQVGGPVESNTAPVAVDDEDYTIAAGQTLVIPAPGIMDNDSDDDGDSITAVVDTLPANGVLSLDTNGAFSYTPNAGFLGDDTFTYQVSDGVADSNIATVTIAVSLSIGVVGSQPPVAFDDEYTTNEGQLLQVTAPGVMSNDTVPENETDPPAASLDSLPVNGTLDFQSDGSFIYMPNPGFLGDDTFTYQVSDGVADSNVATVTININGQPFADDDNFTTNQGQTLIIDTSSILDNDTDPENTQLEAVLDSAPTDGTLSLAPDGTFSYTPAPGFWGVDTFSYHASDGLADSNSATVTITVNGQPFAGDDDYTINQGQSLQVSAPGVMGNDTDPENDSITASLDSVPGNGMLTFQSNGAFTYTPSPVFFGIDSFTYHVSDAGMDSNAATVSINVEAADDPPPPVITHTVTVTLSLQGGSRPDPGGWIVPVTVNFYSPNSVTPLAIRAGNTVRTATGAQFTCLQIPTGTYDVSVVSNHTLINLRRGVDIDGSQGALDFATLLEGDANGDGAIDATDVALLKQSFMKRTGDPGFDVGADFDRNGVVDISDFGLLAINFAMTSPVEVWP